MLFHRFKHAQHIWGPDFVQGEAVGTTPWAYFSDSCCVGVKHHANHGCVCELAGVIRVSYLCVVSVLPVESHTTSNQRLVRANPHSC